jgi:hypothetical protein
VADTGLDAVPDGGVVATVLQNGQSRLIRVGADGTIVDTKLLPPDVTGASVAVDANGDMILATSNTTPGQEYAQIGVYNSDDQLLGQFRTDQFDGTPRNFAADIHLTPGRIYVPTVACDPIQGCNVNRLIYAIEVPGLLGDYPASTILR